MHARRFYLHVDPSTDADGSVPGNSYNVDFSNCTISLKNPLRIRKLSPIVFTCVNSWYPIAQNNVLTFVDSTSTTRTASVAIADYSNNGAGLAAAVQTAMNAAGSTTTFTSTYAGGNFTIQGNNSFTLKFSLNAPLAAILGFKPVDYGAGTSFTSVITSNITGPNYLMLQSRALGMNTIFRNRENPVILRIPVNVGYGSTITFTVDYDAEIHYPDGFLVNQIDFQLVYSDGTSVNLNGIPWSLSMTGWRSDLEIE